MDLKAKYLSETCSDPIDFLYQLRQTTEPIGGGTEYSEDGEFVEYDVAVEAVKKANDAFIGKAVKWLEENASLFVALADEEHSAIGDTKATYGTKSLIYYFKQEFEI